MTGAERFGTFLKRGASQQGGVGGRAEKTGGVTQHRITCSENTSFLNGLKHPEEALCIAPPVSNLCKGFVNTPVAF